MDRKDAPDRWPALMDRRTAAAYLGVSIATLQRFLKRGGVRPLELGLRLRRWRKADLDRVLETLVLEGSTGASAERAALTAVERRSLRKGKSKPRASYRR